MNHRWLWFHLALVGLMLHSAAPARGESNDATVRRLEQRIDELEQQVKALQANSHQKERSLQGVDQRVRILDRKLEVQQEVERAKDLKLPKVEASSKGFFIKSPDEKEFILRIGGYMQADSRFYTQQSPGSASTFLLRRARPFLEGTVDRYYDFRLLMDFGQGQSLVQDFFGDVHYIDEARLRIGKMKGPVGLERLQDDRYLEFVERGFPTQLVPDRQIGVEAHGDIWGDFLEYRLGIYNPTQDNSATTEFSASNPKEFDGRLFFHPFASYSSESVQGLGIGISGTAATSVRNTPLDTYKTTAQNVFFQYNKNAFAAGNRYRISPQFNYYSGPFGLMGEFAYNSQEIGLTSVVDTCPPFGCNKLRVNTQQIPVYSWSIAPTYLITGDDATYKGVKPRHPFNPMTGDWGAIELTARVGQLVVNHDAYKYGFANPNTSAIWALESVAGVNWYLNNNVKFQLNYAYDNFHQGAPNNGNRRPESSFLTDFELMF